VTSPTCRLPRDGLLIPLGVRAGSVRDVDGPPGRACSASGA